MIEKCKLYTNNKKLNVAIAMNLSFFDDGDKTEDATFKKKSDARDEGQVAKSPEIATALLFLGMFVAFKSFGSSIVQNMYDIYRYCFGQIPLAKEEFSAKFITGIVSYLFGRSLLIVAPLFTVAIIMGVLANLFQVGWHPTTKPLKPKFSNLNPLNGIKKLFSLKVLVDLIKSLAKFGVIIYVIYSTLQNEVEKIPLLFAMSVLEAVTYLGSLITSLGMKVGIYFVFIAIADFAYARYKHNKDLKMTKQEVKEEYKQAEGNPQMKGKIKQKMREASMRRMMQDVPQADVIITNPTHFAVALKYDRGSPKAPYVTAKGADHLAQRIKQVGRENDVTLMENRDLARALYANVDIGEEIPEEMYQAVAEVLAFVFKLKNPSL